MNNFYSFGIDSIPNSQQNHYWADFLELLCLASRDNEISKEDAIERIRDQYDDLGEGRQAIEENEDDIIEAEKNDKWSERSEDWFRQLDYRYGHLNTSYPFVVSDGNDLLRLKKRITNNHKLYIFFLLCSSLKSVDRSPRNTLASIFEYSAYKAFKNYLPNGKVYMFGKNQLNDHKYSGHLWNKIDKLSDEIFEKNLVDKADFDPQNYGDGGLDIVGWIPNHDKNNGMPLFFCQCTCQFDWKDKQFDAHPDNFNYISYTSDPIRFTFIPFCFRKSTGDWYYPTEINSILIDRIRICKLLKGSYTEIDRHCNTFVDQVLEYSEDIF